MKGTVNGKSLDQVLNELKAPFPEEELKKLSLIHISEPTRH